MPDRRGGRGRHQARKRAVDLLFEAEARGLTPAEVAEARNALAQKESDVSPLNPYTVTVARGVTETRRAHRRPHLGAPAGLDAGPAARRRQGDPAGGGVGTAARR